MPRRKIVKSELQSSENINDVSPPKKRKTTKTPIEKNDENTQRVELSKNAKVKKSETKEIVVKNEKRTKRTKRDKLDSETNDVNVQTAKVLVNKLEEAENIEQEGPVTRTIRNKTATKNAGTEYSPETKRNGKTKASPNVNEEDGEKLKRNTRTKPLKNNENGEVKRSTRTKTSTKNNENDEVRRSTRAKAPTKNNENDEVKRSTRTKPLTKNNENNEVRRSSRAKAPTKNHENDEVRRSARSKVPTKNNENDKATSTNAKELTENNEEQKIKRNTRSKESKKVNQENHKNDTKLEILNEETVTDRKNKTEVLPVQETKKRRGRKPAATKQKEKSDVTTEFLESNNITKDVEISEGLSEGNITMKQAAVESNKEVLNDNYSKAITTRTRKKVTTAAEKNNENSNTSVRQNTKTLDEKEQTTESIYQQVKTEKEDLPSTLTVRRKQKNKEQSSVAVNEQNEDAQEEMERSSSVEGGKHMLNITVTVQSNRDSGIQESEDKMDESFNPMKPRHQLSRTPDNQQKENHNKNAVRRDSNIFLPLPLMQPLEPEEEQLPPPEDLDQCEIDWEQHKAQLVACRKCKRKYFPHRIKKHEACCKKM